MNPTIVALKQLGGSGTVTEIYETVVALLEIPDGILAIIHGNDRGTQTEVAYRMAWARTYLRKYGVLENSARGIWALSAEGQGIDRVDPKTVVKAVQEQSQKIKNSDQPQDQTLTIATDVIDLKADINADINTDTSAEINGEDGFIPESEEEATPLWRQQLYQTLLALEPAAFERLAQRLLRESGFVQVEVTGRSGDGGIDGKGIVRLSGLLSFHVMFQCKKYQGSVSSSHIRDFRGAIQGRADKGILITTGTFTRDAVKEATRDGATPIDLIDGEELMDKLKNLSLGVTTTLVESVTVNDVWFRSL